MTDNKVSQRYREYIKENLSKKRYNHSVNVAQAAVQLAKRYGADEDKAYIAGLLHDVCKELPAAQQLELVLSSDMDVCEAETEVTALYHAVAGAEFAREYFGIDDEEILAAIRYHTIGCGNMPKLAKMIYLADVISEDRDYKDVKKMRKYAEQSLEKAMFEVSRHYIADAAEKGNTIPQRALDCYNDSVNAMKSKEEQYGKDDSD